MTAIGQELRRKVARLLLREIQIGDTRRDAASHRDGEDPISDLANEDRPVWPPCSPQIGVYMAQLGSGPAFHVDDLEPASGHDRQEAAVGRPERASSTGDALDRTGLQG